VISWLKVYLSGVLMGMADVVPGVSGGTMAFILGIYDRLINALSGVNKASLNLLMKGDFKGVWHHFDLGFLLTLGGGIATSIVLFAQVITYWLSTYPTYLWSFFFGLILASSVLLLKQIEVFNVRVWSVLILGIGIGAFASVLVPVQFDVTFSMIFFSGMVAICAMILPGISGSFLLLLMGMYETIITSIKSMQLDVIMTFGLGALIGLMSFSKLLKWLLSTYKSLTLACLTGIMLGALTKVWPWKETQDLAHVGDKNISVIESLILPWHIKNYHFLDDLALPMVCVFAGLIGVFLINYIFLPKVK
jgi:putative membrane protein